MVLTEISRWFHLRSLTKQKDNAVKFIRKYSVEDFEDSDRYRNQLFPYNGRKQIQPAVEIVRNFHKGKGLLCDPFAGSGIFPLAFEKLGRKFIASEWDPAWNRLANSPWRLPPREEVEAACTDLMEMVEDELNGLYATTCVCGKRHYFRYMDYHRCEYCTELSFTKSGKILCECDPSTPVYSTRDSRFFLGRNGKFHDRSGANGCNVIYRNENRTLGIRDQRIPQDYTCDCGAKEKEFDTSDQETLDMVNAIHLTDFILENILDRPLIQNGRINIVEGRLLGEIYHHRGLVALGILHNALESLRDNHGQAALMQLHDVFLYCVIRARYADKNSKVTELYHRPYKTNREPNLLYDFKERFEKRMNVMYCEDYPRKNRIEDPPISCLDYRDLFKQAKKNSVGLILTDPPWQDGTPYFEQAQILHPWVESGYNLADDEARLTGEVGVTGAPSRPKKQSTVQWYNSIREFFELSRFAMQDYGTIALLCKPTSSAGQKPMIFTRDLNAISVAAKASGYEPLRKVPVTFDSIHDPGMRMQQGATNTFQKSCIFLFTKLPDHHRRWYLDYDEEKLPVDLDEVGYHIARDLVSVKIDQGLEDSDGQEDGVDGSIAYANWKQEFCRTVVARFSPSPEVFGNQNKKIKAVFHRICAPLRPFSKRYLPRDDVSYASAFNQVNPLSRARIYMEKFLKAKGNKSFTYEEMIFQISAYLEEGDIQLLRDSELIGSKLRQLIRWRCEADETGTYIAKTPAKFEPKSGGKHPSKLPPETHGKNRKSDYVDFIVKLLQKMGYTDVIRTPNIGDEGRDIDATDPQGRPGAVEVKHWKNGVGSAPIQRVSTYARAEGKKWAMAFASSHFTGGLTGGEFWARKLGVSTYSGLEIDDLMRMYWPNYPN